MGFEERNDLSKFATVLKGPGTLLIKTNLEERNFFVATQTEEIQKSIIRNNGTNKNIMDKEFRTKMDKKNIVSCQYMQYKCKKKRKFVINVHTSIIKNGFYRKEYNRQLNNLLYCEEDHNNEKQLNKFLI